MLLLLCCPDHIHTNFRGLYRHLRSAGYFVDVLSRDLLCFDAQLYSSLLLVDTEEDFSALEVEKLEKDVIAGLSVVVFADWHDPDYSANHLRFRDDNTRRWWSPAVGGANIPSINELLRPFGIAFGPGRLSGTFSLDGRTAAFSDGTFLTRFPMTGRVVYASLREPPGTPATASAKGNSGAGANAGDEPAGAASAPGGGTEVSNDKVEGDREFPVFGMVRVDGASSFLAAFGDSGCIDDGRLQHASDCFFLLDRIRAYSLASAVVHGDTAGFVCMLTHVYSPGCLQWGQSAVGMGVKMMSSARSVNGCRRSSQLVTTNQTSFTEGPPRSRWSRSGGRNCLEMDGNSLHPAAIADIQRSLPLASVRFR